MKRTNHKSEDMKENDLKFFASDTMKLPLIAIAQQKKYIILSPPEIIYCGAEGSYTHVYMSSGEVFLVSLKLKTMSELLQMWPEFVRIHHSYLINVSMLKHIETGDGWQACMVNSQLLPVSNSRRPLLMSVFHTERDQRDGKGGDGA